MDLPPVLAKQVGPFPVAGWLGIIAAGVGIGVLVRRSSLFDGGTEPDVPAVEDDPAAGAVASTGYYGAGAGLPGAFPGGNGQPPPPSGVATAPATNQEWSMAAVRFLIAGGVDPVIADAAIGNYLQGNPLDARHSAALSIALRQLGPPPEGAPPVSGTPAPPPSLPSGNPPIMGPTPGQRPPRPPKTPKPPRTAPPLILTGHPVGTRTVPQWQADDLAAAYASGGQEAYDRLARQQAALNG